MPPCAEHKNDTGRPPPGCGRGAAFLGGRTHEIQPYAPGLLFVPECDDCYFVYWSFDSLRDWLLTRPSTAGVEIVGVPENGRYLGNLLGVLQGKLYFIPVVGPILRGLLMGGALWALVYLLARRARRGPVGRGEAFSMALALVLLAPRGIWQEALSWGAGLVNYLLPMVILLVLLELFARRRPPSALLAGALAFCGCLFMETATILLAAAGACAGLLFRRSDRRRAALGLWLGSWLGALVMFTASGYRTPAIAAAPTPTGGWTCPWPWSTCGRS